MEQSARYDKERPPASRDARADLSPEAMAKRAVARKPTTPSGHRVKLVLTLFLPQDVAEYITARAIREGKNVAGLIAEILREERRRKGVRVTRTTMTPAASGVAGDPGRRGSPALLRHRVSPRVLGCEADETWLLKPAVSVRAAGFAKSTRRWPASRSVGRDAMSESHLPAVVGNGDRIPRLASSARAEAMSRGGCRARSYACECCVATFPAGAAAGEPRDIQGDMSTS
jgi:hypothetical protein